jgi:hypothetical protein
MNKRENRGDQYVLKDDDKELEEENRDVLPESISPTTVKLILNTPLFKGSSLTEKSSEKLLINRITKV